MKQLRLDAGQLSGFHGSPGAAVASTAYAHPHCGPQKNCPPARHGPLPRHEIHVSG